MEEIPVYHPLLGPDEYDAARKALELGWLGMGSFVKQFEDSIAAQIDAPDRHVVAVNTGHSALHLALIIAGIGPGDEVITPSFNNISDFQAILATGASPVLCDVLDASVCIDVKKAAQLVTPRTKAVIATDYGCMLADHDALNEWASAAKLRVVHDAAHSIGSQYKGRRIGSFSDMTMFSFDPVKTVTCIDGGALIVRSAEDVPILHEMRLAGMGQRASVMYTNARAWTYDVTRLGFRYHMANLHAAIGLAQMSKLDRIIRSRVETCRFFSEGMRDLPGLGIPQTNFNDVCPFAYTVRVRDNKRDAFREHLRSRGVDSGIHWRPGHQFTLLSNAKRGDLSVTEQIGQEIVTVPMHSEMKKEWAIRVVEAVRSFFGRS
jgi:dTDP-4-amino-4,6-dideoxygalactose transaminase